MNDDKQTNNAKYSIIRFYMKGGRKVIRKGLTLAEVQKHCNDPKTRKANEWFDGYSKE